MIKDLRPALLALLYADADIYTAVGGAGTQDAGGRRIYPLMLKQGQKQPSIVYSRVSNVGDHHMRGPSGLSQPRVQIDCWADTLNGAASLADQVKNRLDGFRGTVSFGSASPQDTVDILGAFFDGEREDYDDAAKMYRVSRDYFIWFREF